jgi:hypothetical protein
MVAEVTARMPTQMYQGTERSLLEANGRPGKEAVVADIHLSCKVESA